MLSQNYFLFFFLYIVLFLPVTTCYLLPNLKNPHKYGVFEAILGNSLVTGIR